jgi:MFS family permease
MNRRLLLCLCLAEVLGMANYAGFAALLPRFVEAWSLSNAQAGWISGIYFAGYTVVVPFLVALTDKLDTRRIYLASTALVAASTLAYAVLADGFWTAMILRTLTGIGLAGTYMPGLRVLTDHTAETQRARVTGFYTASYSAAASLSFVFIGVFDVWWGWRWAFGISGLMACAALALTLWVIPPDPPKDAPNWRAIRGALDFAPVLRNRRAIGFMIAYLAVVWGLSANRSWFVALYSYSASVQEAGAVIWSATLVAALLNLVGLPASLLGNEAAIRYGHVRAIVWFYVAASAAILLFGLSLSLPYVALVVLGAVMVFVLNANGSSVTSGVAAVAEPARRGATIAVHSCLGFFGGFLGPLVFGYALDFGGGTDSPSAWLAAFASSAAVCLIGAGAVLALSRAPSPRAAHRP